MKEDNANNQAYYKIVEEMIDKVSKEVGEDAEEIDQKIRDIVIYICMMTIRN